MRFGVLLILMIPRFTRHETKIPVVVRHGLASTRSLLRNFVNVDCRMQVPKCTNSPCDSATPLAMSCLGNKAFVLASPCDDNL